MINPNYYLTTNFSIAQIGKVGSSSLALLVIQQFYPDIYAKISNAAFPVGKTVNTQMWQALAPKLRMQPQPPKAAPLEPTLPVLMFVRDPVQRFLSACAQMNITDVDSTLATMESDQYPATNFHFWHQHKYAKEVGGIPAQQFKFPDDIQSLLTVAEITIPFQKINQSHNLKPIPSDLQIGRIQEFYAKDIELYNNL